MSMGYPSKCHKGGRGGLTPIHHFCVVTTTYIQFDIDQNRYANFTNKNRLCVPICTYIHKGK